MTAINTGPDALQRFYTGASSDGGSQAVASACLGHYRSSTQVPGLIASGGSISGLTITYASAANGTAGGAGILEVLAGGATMAWTAPGSSTQGSADNISNGVPVVLSDGANPSAYIIVTPSVSSATPGTASITLSTSLNAVITGDDATPTETTAGSVKYHAIMLKNTSAAALQNVYAYLKTLGTAAVSGVAQLGASGAGTITTAGSFSDWPVSGFCRIETSGNALREVVYYSSRTSTSLTVPAAGRAAMGSSAAAGANTDNLYPIPRLSIAGETPSSSAIQTIGSETSTPSGRTWVTGIRAADGVSIGTMAASGLYGLWLRRHILAGTIAAASILDDVVYQFDAA